jgi:hypothetical protein
MSESSLKMEDSKKIKIDKHGSMLDDPNLKGIKRFINSSTIRGRANAAKATILAMTGLYYYYSNSNVTQKPGQPGETTISDELSSSTQKQNNPTIQKQRNVS